MRKTLGWICFLVFLAMTSCDKNRTDSDNQMVIDTIPMMITRIQQCSKLYTAEYQVHKIITHDDKKQITGTFLNKDFSIDIPAGKRKVAIPIDATLKAYIDFASFGEENVKKKGDKIEIILPDPKVTLTASKVDHEGIRQYVALIRSNFSDEELTRYERQGRESIIKDIPNMGIIETARESAARTLIPIICQLGYSEEDVKITFRKEFTLSDLGTLLDKTTVEHGATD